MGFADYKPPREHVPFGGGGGGVWVRGLSLDDLSRLVRTHFVDLEGLLRLYDDQVASGPFPGLGSLGLDELVLTLCRDAPQFAATVLLLAAEEAGDERAEAAIRTLPFPVLVDALAKVGRLTFEEAGGLGNFLATFAALLGRTLPQAAVDRLRASPARALVPEPAG